LTDAEIAELDCPPAIFCCAGGEGNRNGNGYYEYEDGTIAFSAENTALSEED
jgi:hypothetical protein